MILQWGRVYRGRVFHLIYKVLDGGGTLTYCGDTIRLQEVADVLPPRGALVCDRCQRVVEELASNMALAVKAQNQPGAAAAELADRFAHQTETAAAADAQIADLLGP